MEFMLFSVSVVNVGGFLGLSGRLLLSNTISYTDILIARSLIEYKHLDHTTKHEVAKRARKGQE